MILLLKCLTNNNGLAISGRIYSTVFQNHQVNVHLARCKKFKQICIQGTRNYHTTKLLRQRFVNSATNSGLKKEKNLSELRRLLTLAAPEKWTLFGAITFLFISSTVTMAVPYCLGKIIDIIYTTDKKKMKENLNNVCLVFCGIFFIGGLSNFCRIYMMSTAGHRITQVIRKKAYAAILSQETAMFDRQSTGELVGRLTGDAQLVSSAVTQNISDGLRSAIMTATGVSMMFYVSPQLALVGLSIVPPVVFLAALYGRFVKGISRDVQNGLAALNSTAEERISNIRTVKAFAQEVREIETYGSKLQDLLQLCYKESFYKGIFFGLTGFSGNAIILLVLYYGGTMVAESTITIGDLSAFLLYAAYVGISLNGLSSFYSELYKGLGASTRLFELMERQPLIPISGGKILDKELSGGVSFQNVSFSFPTRKSLVLKDFNLNIQANTTLAIVGASGSGKSTVAALLLRFYDPDKGCILLDNYDLRELDPVWVKSQISIVSQEPILFSGTIKENVMYGMKNATELDVREAVEDAKVLEFVEKMPDGLDTMVGERGITLSGGQRQRVAIARALIKKPKILILDEATSALDARSESLIQETLEKAARGRTVLIIAHRLSTIKNADKIMVLDQGQIVESGNYEELIGLENGYFRKLIKHQTPT